MAQILSIRNYLFRKNRNTTTSHKQRVQKQLEQSSVGWHDVVKDIWEDRRWMCLEQDPKPSNTYLWSLRYRYLEPHELSPCFFQSKTNPFLSARGVLGITQATWWSNKKGSVGNLWLPPLPRGRSGASHMASLPFHAAQTLPEGKEDWRALQVWVTA